MFAIRREQLEVFERTALRQFEDEMVVHLHRMAPKHTDGIGESGLRQVVKDGVERAKTYGFTDRGPVRFFIEMMVMFGSGFDHDPLLAWAGRLLTTAGGGQMARADWLHAEAMAYRDAVIGPDYEVEAAAIRRLVERPVETWLSGDLSDPGLEAAIRAVYPEKCDRAEPGAVAAVIGLGRAAARDRGLPPASGGAVCAALMTALGHACLADPQFPWIAASLEGSRGQSPEKRVERLAIRTLAYLSDGLAELEKG
ncbi:MAG TPA: hypothetical protein VF590_02685 [Isosphaeraceae bacterium]|jgi:hypothetical protein